MQDLHAHCNLRIIKCKLCGEERHFDGYNIDTLESWKDRHYRDGRPVCVGAYPAHVRDKLAPIIAAGQESTPENNRPRYHLYVGIVNSMVESMASMRREVAQAYHVPEWMVRNDDSQPRLVYDDVGLMRCNEAWPYQISLDEIATRDENLQTHLDNLGTSLVVTQHPLVKTVSFRQWKDEMRRCYTLAIEMDYHDGRIQGYQWLVDDIQILHGNRTRYWLDWVYGFEGNTGLKWKELPLTLENWQFLIGYDRQLFGR